MKSSAARALAIANSRILFEVPPPPGGAGLNPTQDAATREASPVPRPAARAAAAPWTPRVLVADDEYRIRLALRTCLEAEGYEVDEARDGREAVDCVIGEAPDVLLIDLAMPVLDGLSALRELASRGDVTKPRIIVLTAYGSISAAQMAHELGVVAFLEKPVSPEALRAAVALALR